MILKNGLLTGAIALLWLIFYSANHELFKFAEISSWISLIFIPSGFKIAAVAIFRSRALLGLFIGSLMTGFFFLNDFLFVDLAVFSLFSSTLPYVALKITEMFFFIKPCLSNLSLRHVLSLGVIYGLLNGMFHVGYRYHALFIRDVHKLHEFLSMMVGDILGILIFMYLVSRLTRYAYATAKKT